MTLNRVNTSLDRVKEKAEDLDMVRRRNAEHERTFGAELHQAMRDANAEGESMTAIGDAAGLTRQRVWQILNAEPESNKEER